MGYLVVIFGLIICYCAFDYFMVQDENSAI